MVWHQNQAVRLNTVKNQPVFNATRNVPAQQNPVLPATDTEYTGTVISQVGQAWPGMEHAKLHSAPRPVVRCDAG